MAYSVKRQSGRYTGYYTEPNGTALSAGTFGTEAEALRAARREEDRIAENRWFDPRKGRSTLAAFADDWVERPKKLSASALANDVQNYKKHVQPHFGDWPISGITFTAVQDFIDAKGEAGLSYGTREKLRNLLSKIMKAAMREGLVQSNPVTGVDLGTKIERARRYPTPAEVSAIAGAIDPRYRTLIWTAYTTGLRAGELVALRVGSVNMVRGSIHVAGSITEVGGTLTSTDGKTSAASRTVPVPPAVLSMLSDEMQSKSSDDHVFTAQRGGVMRMSNWHDRFLRPARDAAGVGHEVDMHSLRHGAITNWAKDRLASSLWELKAWAGHSSINTTERYFGHFYDDTTGTQVAALDAMIVDVGNVVPMVRHG